MNRRRSSTGSRSHASYLDNISNGLSTRQTIIKNAIVAIPYLDPPDKLYKVKSHLSAAADVEFLPENHLVVADPVGGHVVIFDEEGVFVKKLAKGVRPFGVGANRGGMIAFTDSRTGKDRLVHIYPPDQDDLGENTWGQDLAWKPRGLAVSNRGQLIITDIYPEKHDVGLYSLDGREILKFNKNLKEKFSSPLYVTMDIFDRVVVSDRNNHKIKIFDDRSGQFISEFGTKEDEKLHLPRGVCTDVQGNIIVADAGNQRVALFSPEGKFIQNLLTSDRDRLTYPFGVSCTRRGQLAVSQHSGLSQDFRKLRLYQIFDNVAPSTVFEMDED